MTSKTSKPIKSRRDFKSSKSNIKKYSGSKSKKQVQEKKSKVSKNHAGEYAFTLLKDDNFRLQSQKVFFTYKHHIPFNDLYNFINGLFPIKQYIICHENGDEQNNYLHTHMSVDFEKKLDVRNCRQFDYKLNDEIIHPNVGTTRNWPASVNYCLKIWKEDPKPGSENWFSNFDIVEFLKHNKRNKCVQEINLKELCKRIDSYKSFTETIENECSELKDVIPLQTLYNNKRRPIDPKVIKYFQKWEQSMRKWQTDLYNILDKKSNRRKVYWVVDEVGGQGKTDFCTYVDTIKKKDECLTIAASGSLRDIADVVRNWMDRGAYPKIILIDIPRTFNDDKHNSIYTIIESIKNGRLTCTKYKGDTLQFYPPHVMVFSNWMPDISFLSKDRWIILNLKSKYADDKNAILKKINIDCIKKNELDDDYEELDFEFIDTESEKGEINDEESDMDMSFNESDFLDSDDDNSNIIVKKSNSNKKYTCFLCYKNFDMVADSGMRDPWGSNTPACGKCISKVNNLKDKNGRCYESAHQAFKKLHKMSVTDAVKKFKKNNSYI